ncbi:MAG: hypothetical protein MRZ90_05055 [Candidatus Gastranaerophilales bacterium]|nr:hypothetical protein [Candidatus Gastranaerophilales bacterium]
MNIASLKKDELENELIKYVNYYFINIQKWQRVNSIINIMMTTKNPNSIHKHVKDDLHWIFGIDFYVIFLRKKYSNKYNYAYHSHDNYKKYKEYINEFVAINKENILNNNRETVYKNLSDEYNIFFIMHENNVIGFVITHSIKDRFSDLDINIFNIIANSYSLALTNFSYYNKIEVGNIRKLNLIENISKEFKPMLNNILEYSSLLNLHKDLPINRKENYIRYIENNSTYLKSLITNIFDLSNEDFKTTQPELTSFNSRDAIIECLDIFEDYLKQRNINFITSIISHEIFADLTKFKQVIFSLINNITKFANDNDVIYVTSYINKNYFNLEFKNKIQKHVDTDFTSQNNIYYFNNQSADLSVIKKIIKQHNGKIKFMLKKSTNTIMLNLLLPLAEKDSENN